jgi:hypothetical protein
MGKRSTFKRVEKDAYQTIDPRAFPPLLPHVQHVRSYAEPFVGEGRLVAHLEEMAPWMECGYANDIERGEDVLTGDELANNRERYDAIISNPPWSRKLLHPIIEKLAAIAPTYLLFDASWAFTKQARPFLPYCVKIISVGRLKWIPGTKMSGKDDCAFYYFNKDHDGGPRFYNE